MLTGRYLVQGTWRQLAFPTAHRIDNDPQLPHDSPVATERIIQRRRVRPLKALSATRRLMDEPESTELVFEIIGHLAGPNFERLYERSMADPVGHAILEERRDLLPTLNDRATLAALPDRTLGATYARFMEAEQITADGLEDASQIEEVEFYDDRARCLSERLRDMHDLWHIVSGYGRDYLGEASLLAFTYAQTRNRGIGFIVLMAAYRYRRGGHPTAVSVMREAYRRGRAAQFLPAADWEALLALPLDDVRTHLGIGDPPYYEPDLGEDATAHVADDEPPLPASTHGEPLHG